MGGDGGGRNAKVDWTILPHGDETHASTTDPDAKLFCKGCNQAAIQAYQGHVLMEVALAKLDTVPSQHRKMLAADKGYDARDFIFQCRQRRVTSHVAGHTTRLDLSAVDARDAPCQLCRQSTHTKAHRRALRLWKNLGPHPSDRLPQTQACRPALQAEHDREQHRANGLTTERDRAAMPAS